MNKPESPDNIGNGTEKIRIELAVNVAKQDDLTKISKALETKGVEIVSSDLEGKTIQLEFGSSTSINERFGGVQALQTFVEKETGFLTVVKGLGQLSSAVAELRPSSSSHSDSGQIFGVVRITQLTGNSCFFDGSLSGLSVHDKHTCLLAVHEFGDLGGDSYESIGPAMLKIYNQSSDGKPVGTELGSMSIRKLLPNCDVAHMIGRSVAVSRESHEEKKGGPVILSAGVIARASIVETNKKQICSCSGKTLWEERLGMMKKNE